jgi:hypothetical protein
MASLTITQTSPVVNTVAVTQTVSPVTLEITEQVTQHTVVVSPQNITNYYGGGGEVLAALTGVAPGSTDLGTFTEDIIADNETIKGALQDLEDGVVNNEAAIGTNASDISTNATGISDNANDITGLTTTVNSNTSSINTNTSDITSLQTTVSGLTTGALTQALDPTELSLFFTDPGTYAQGTSVETVLRDILIHYQTPVLNNVNGTGLPNTNIEHGSTDTLTDITWTITNPQNVDAAVTGTLTYFDPVGTDDQTWTGVAHTASPYNITNKSVTYNVAASNAGQTGTNKNQQNTYYLRLSGFQDTNGASISADTDYYTVLFKTFILTSATQINAGAVNNTTGNQLITDCLAGTNNATVERNLLHATSLLQTTLTYPNTTNYWYACMPQCHWDDVTTVTTNQGFDGFDITTTVVNCGSFVYTNNQSASVTMQLLRGQSIGQIDSGNYIKFA